MEYENSHDDPLMRASKKGELLAVEERLFNTQFKWEESRQTLLMLTESANNKLEQFEREVDTGSLVLPPTMDEFAAELKLRLTVEELSDPIDEANLTEYRTVKDRLTKTGYWQSEKTINVLSEIGARFAALEAQLLDSKFNTKELPLGSIRGLLQTLDAEVNDATVDEVLQGSSKELKGLLEAFEQTEIPHIEKYSERETENFLKRQNERILGSKAQLDILSNSFADAAYPKKDKKKKNRNLPPPTDTGPNGTGGVWENEWWYKSRDALEKSIESLVVSEGTGVLSSLRTLSERAQKIVEVLKGQLQLISAVETDLDMHKPSIEGLVECEQHCGTLIKLKKHLKETCESELRHLRKQIGSFDREMSTWEGRFDIIKQESDTRLRQNEIKQQELWDTIQESQRKLQILMEQRYQEINKRVEANDKHLFRHGWTIHTRQLALKHEEKLKVTMDVCHHSMAYAERVLQTAQSINNITILTHDKKKGKITAQRDRCTQEWSRIFHTVISLWIDVGTKLGRQKARYIDELNNVETHARNQLIFFQDTSDPQERATHLAISIIKEMRKEQITQLIELHSQAKHVLQELAPDQLHLYTRQQAETLLTDLQNILEKAEKTSRAITDKKLPPPPSSNSTKKMLPSKEDELSYPSSSDSESEHQHDPLDEDIQLTHAAKNGNYYTSNAIQSGSLLTERPHSAPSWVTKAAASPNSPAAKMVVKQREEDASKLPLAKHNVLPVVQRSEHGRTTSNHTNNSNNKSLPKMRPSSSPPTTTTTTPTTATPPVKTLHQLLTGDTAKQVLTQTSKNPNPVSGIDTTTENLRSATSLSGDDDDDDEEEEEFDNSEGDSVPATPPLLHTEIPNMNTPPRHRKITRHTRPHSAAAGLITGKPSTPTITTMPELSTRPHTATNIRTVRSVFGGRNPAPANASEGIKALFEDKGAGAGNLSSKYKQLYDELYSPVASSGKPISVTTLDHEADTLQSSILGIARPVVSLKFTSSKENEFDANNPEMFDEKAENEVTKSKLQPSHTFDSFNKLGKAKGATETPHTALYSHF